MEFRPQIGQIIFFLGGGLLKTENMLMGLRAFINEFIDRYILTIQSHIVLWAVL